MLRSLRDERGMTLPLVLAMLAVIALTVTGTMTYTASNQGSSARSKSAEAARQLAEAGVNNAVAVLSHDNTNAGDGNALTAPEGTPCPDGSNCFEQTYSTGYVRWRGAWVSEGTGGHWLIDSWGYARHPQPGQAMIVRYVKASVSVVASPSQIVNATGWKFVLANKTSNSTTCDMSLANTAQITSPFYVAGNLCLSQQARVWEPDVNDPVWLVVRGKLVLQNQAKVGNSSTEKVTKAEIGACASSITGSTWACNPNAPTNDRVWAHSLVTSPTTIITKPAADYASWYENANPGPTNACNPADANAPVFDNNGVINLATGGSVGTQSITPSTKSYTCIGKNSQGVEIGRLQWNHVDRTMVVSGAIYIDGSVLMDNNVLIKYSGQASLYLSGTFTINGGQQRFCAAWSGTDCDFDAWNPNTDMLIVVAQGVDANGDSIKFNNSVQWQGGFHAKGNINLGESSLSEGPMMGEEIKISQSAQIRPLPPMTHVPIGAPGNPTTQAVPQRPIYFPNG